MSVQVRRNATEIEPGRVVEVRGGLWAVTDVRQQGLPRSSADDGRVGLQHVVTLQSLDEDRLGDELSVVWELEVGNTLVPNQGLPERLTADGFDDPTVLGAFVDAVRWGAVTSADAGAFQAPFRSGAAVHPYQLEPLRRALSAPRTNLLLADDVGLGKTIEAGLVIQELLLRHRARSVIIVCPPSLALKWQDEMREKFGLAFEIVDSEQLAQTRRRHGLGTNPFTLFPRIIVSMAWLPGPRAQRLLRNLLALADSHESARRYAFDVLVVDEAHHIAPASPSALGGGRGYAVDSARTRAVNELAKRCEHRLFLSATPHNGYAESFTALLEMIDDRRFSRGATIDPAALRDVTVRRLKTEINELDFRPRVIEDLPFDPDPEEEAAFAELDAILTASAKAAGRKSPADILSLLLKKRFLSSPWAFARTLEQYVESPDGGRTVDDYEAILGSAASDEEEGALEHPELSAIVRAKGNDPLSEATRQQIDSLIDFGRGYEARPDARLNALLGYLDAVCRPSGRKGPWSNERVVVFTEYADTLAWAERVLRAAGYDAERLATIQGSTDAEKRENVRARFTAPPEDEPIRVLLATDAAGEGIDLQDYCHRLVNLDVPFNPSRLEQRIGRIDRYGQRTNPEIRYLKPAAASSQYAQDIAFFVDKVAKKVAAVRRDLGSANTLVDAEIKQHFLGETPGRAGAEDGNAIVQQALAGEYQLNRQLTRLSQTYAEQKERMHIAPFNLRRVVDTALTLANEPVLAVDVDREDGEPESFSVEHLGSAWQPALAGLDTRLARGKLRPITFDENVAKERRDVVHVHLGHALLDKAARQLRNSLVGSASRVHGVTAVVDDRLPESCAAVVSRLVLVGKGGIRLHEEVFLAGVRLKGRVMAEDRITNILDEALDSSTLTLPNETVRAELARQWGSEGMELRRRLDDAMRRRAERRQEAVQGRLDERRDADVDRAHEIFAAFRVNLEDSLKRLQAEDDAHAWQLLPDEQARQRRRDIEAMQRRLESLAAEEDREVAGIRRRFEDPRHFVSAAAVVFALTPADAADLGGTR